MYDQLFDDQSIDRELADVQVRDRTIADLRTGIIERDDVRALNQQVSFDHA